MGNLAKGDQLQKRHLIETPELLKFMNYELRAAAPTKLHHDQFKELKHEMKVAHGNIFSYK